MRGAAITSQHVLPGRIGTELPPASSPSFSRTEADSRWFARHGWRTFGALVCFLQGVALTLNVHPAGDGMWFWYARLYREHHLIYGVMHLPLQPLFVLMTAWMQDILGLGWLQSKVLALMQLAAFCFSLWLLAGRIPWKDWQRSILLVATYSLTLTSSYFRFDDYHVTGYCLVVVSIYIMTRMGEEIRQRSILALTMLLGIVSGLALSNRLNDGAALFVGVAFVFIIAFKRIRWTALPLLTASAAITFFFIILLTGDTIHNWFFYSILRAAAIKGGSHSVLLGPLRVLLAMSRTVFLYRKTWACAIYGAFVIALVELVVRRRLDPLSPRLSRMWQVWVLVASAAFLVWQSFVGHFNAAIGAWGLLLSLGLAAWYALRLARSEWFAGRGGLDWQKALIVIPFLQIMAGMVTSGGSPLETYPPIGVMLLILPICIPRIFQTGWPKRALVGMALMIGISGFIAKAEDPYSWIHFRNESMFKKREWYQHPVYGPVYIETAQARLFSQICARVEAGGQPSDMLEVTNPYANWFCDVPPWHDFVQSWYDTTSRQTIETMDAELRATPPRWILYERSPFTLQANERAFGAGKQLPHREFDQLVLSKLASGEWTLAEGVGYRSDDWLLIETVPTAHHQSLIYPPDLPIVLP